MQEAGSAASYTSFSPEAEARSHVWVASWLLPSLLPLQELYAEREARADAEDRYEEASGQLEYEKRRIGVLEVRAVHAVHAGRMPFHARCARWAHAASPARE